MQPLQPNPSATQLKKKPAYTNNSILESLRDLGSGVGKSVAKDVVGAVASDALTSLFGRPTGGDLRPQQPVEVASRERQPYPFPMRKPEVYQPIRPVIHEEVGVKEKLEAVRIELKTLAASIKKFNSQIERAIEDIPARPGIYHVNFLERLRGIIMTLRQNIEDSGAWLALWTGRKKKKQYWGMYKKHGTSFGLSSERNVATQAG